MVEVSILGAMRYDDRVKAPDFSNKVMSRYLRKGYYWDGDADLEVPPSN
jgi:hypothetical protein